MASEEIKAACVDPELPGQSPQATECDAIKEAQDEECIAPKVKPLQRDVVDQPESSTIENPYPWWI